MKYYPVYLNLEGRSCLVVGAGSVGRRKIAALLDRSPGSLDIVDTRPPDASDPGVKAIVENPSVTYHTRTFEDADLDGKFLVIASTDNEELNWRISRLCNDRSILCNIVDQPEKCSFIVPAVLTQGDLTLAISTAGSSPALAKKIRRDLEDYFGSHYGAFLRLMARLRPMVLGLGRDTRDNSAIFRALVHSEILEAMEKDDQELVAEILRAHLPEELHPNIGELIHDLV